MLMLRPKDQKRRPADRPMLRRLYEHVVRMLKSSCLADQCDIETVCAVVGG